MTLLRDGGIKSFELKGDLDLRITDPALAKIRLTLASNDYSELQFKQHPNVAKFSGADKIIGLKDANRSFPVGQGLGVLRWRMNAKDESNVPLSSGSIVLRNLADGSYMLATAPRRRIFGRGSRVRARSESSYPAQCGHLHSHPVSGHWRVELILRPNSLPSVTGEADWRSERNAFIWTIDTIDSDNPTGSLEFKCEGDADVFFPVSVGFVAAGSLAKVDVSLCREASDGIKKAK